jgi:hypothetical protein
MKRKDLVERLHEFVAAEDNIFLAALVRMGDRAGRRSHFSEKRQRRREPIVAWAYAYEQLRLCTD